MPWSLLNIIDEILFRGTAEACWSDNKAAIRICRGSFAVKWISADCAVSNAEIPTGELYYSASSQETDMQ
jgi:hypothetical protein